MAGFDVNNSAININLTTPPKPVLPSGPCRKHDAFGPCGCDQFWDKTSAELHEGSREHRLSSERSTLCVCGHHACFHAREARPLVERPQLPAVGVQAHTHLRCACGVQCQSQPGSQCNAQTGVRSTSQEARVPESDQPMHNMRPKTSPPESNRLLLRQAISQNSTLGMNDGMPHPLSRPSSSGLPPVPSVCLRSEDRRPATENQARGHLIPQRQHVAGLGLGLSSSFGNLGGTLDRPPSATSTVPDDFGGPAGRPHSELKLPSTKANSMRSGQGQIDSPSLGPMEQVKRFVEDQALHLATGGDTIPNTCNLDDFIQSATEVATPSIANTPDLRPFDQAVQTAVPLVNNLLHLASKQQENSSETMTNGTTPAPIPQLLLPNTSSTAQEVLHQALNSASPREFQILMSYLQPLYNWLTSLPNMANAVRELHGRMDVFESSSFNHLQPDDVQRQFETCDYRILELEHRMDDHERLHQTIDADNSMNSFTRQCLVNVTESFSSNHSATAPISDARIAELEDRIHNLEKSGPPTSINTWEVEVVLLPWGRELQGIWYSPDQPMRDEGTVTTQDPEEWTQARNVRSSSILQRSSPGREKVTDSNSASNRQLSLRSSMPFSDAESGWSEQAISEWAEGSTDEWLSPKSCGVDNQCYKRLQSRGFVRNVTLRSASARDIQASLSNAFSDLMEHLRYTEEDEDPTTSSYPGLRASFIPLRKVFKESRLRFLTPSEMASSALWSAQFLTSGVIMRVPGGQKRLYVTQREAYMQHADRMGSSWTWQELRSLPRYHADPDAQMEGNEEQCQTQVAEADAREECWAFNPKYDAPPASVAASFSSDRSAQIAMRPADRTWRRSITPSSILKNRQTLPQPISPLSEHHPQRPGQGRARTVSAPQVDVALLSSTKRRLESSPVKPSSAPHVTSRTPSVSVGRPKRRRVALSSSSQPDKDQRDAGVLLGVNTPRRSHEPSSPFFSSPPRLPRTSSDVASRVGKGTPFAYATPHSGPYMGGSAGYGGGDTEPDSDNDGDADDDDDEQSWAGVGDEQEEIDIDSDAEAGADEHANFSGSESSFPTEDDDGEEGDDEGEFGAQNQYDSDDGDTDVLDKLLGVLESQ